jgi:tetratricopeptide (TPR) repeat protein
MKTGFALFLVFACLSCSYNKEKIHKDADALVHAKEYKKAIPLYTKILNRDTCLGCLFDRGLSYLQTEQFDKSISDYDEYINTNKTKWEAYANRASAWYRKNKYKEALKDYLTAHSLKPIFHNQISHMLFITGKKDEACTYYRAAMANGHTDFDESITEYCNPD